MIPDRNWAVAALLLAGALGGCARGSAPATLQPSPELLAIPTDSMPPRLGRTPPVPEAVPLERWREPFSVTARGEVMAREPRDVVVLQPVLPAEGILVAAADSTAATGAADTASALPAPGPERASRPVAAEAARSHRVERGDTWFGLARRYGVSPAALGEANPGVEPGRIRIGQRLRIPAAGPAESARRTHRVEPGETLWGIARSHGISVERLRRANRLDEDSPIGVGQLLVIPDTEEG